MLGQGLAQTTQIVPKAQIQAKPLVTPRITPEAAIPATTTPTSSPFALGAKTSGMVTATKVGEGPNAFGGLSTATNQITHLPGLGFMSLIHRNNNLICGGQSGQFRYAYSTDLGQTWDVAQGGTGTCYGYGAINPAHTQAGRYPNLFAFLPGGATELDSVRLAYGGWSHNGVGGNTTINWTGNVAGVVSDPAGWLNPTTNVAQEAYPMYLLGGLDYGATNMVERLPGEYWMPLVNRDQSSNDEGNIDLWKGLYNSNTGELDWTKEAVISPNHTNTGTNGDPVIGSPNMAFGPNGNDGILIWTGDLVSNNPLGIDSTANLIYTRTSDGGATWDAPEEFDLLAYPNLTERLQSALFINAAGDTLPSSTGVGTLSFTSDVVVDANGTPHIIARVATGQINQADGTVSPLGFIYPTLPKVLVDFTLDNNGDWNGIFLADIACWVGEFTDGSASDGTVLIDVWCQAARSEDGTKIFFSWTDTDTTGIGGADNLSPDLFGRALDITTMQLTPITDWTDGDPSWDGNVFLPTIAPIALDKGSNVFGVPTMVSEFTDAAQTTGYWYFSDIEYDLGTATIPVDFLSDCAQSTLAATPTVTAPTCGANDGTINANVSGGVSPYTYAWSTGATTAALSGIGPGTYSVFITDGDGCSVTEDFFIQSANAPVAAEVTVADISCAGQTDGSATFTMTGGSSPYAFAWDNGETDSVATALVAGTTGVTITDANGCVTFAEATITEPVALTIVNTVDGQVTCDGDTDGEVSVTATGGTGTYTYDWDNGTSGQTISGLPANDYVVTVTDQNGCTTTGFATVEAAVSFDPIIAANALTTFPNSGSILIEVANSPGNGAPYTYTITLLGVDGMAATTPYDTVAVINQPDGFTLDELCGGTYEVVVEDAAGCIQTDTVEVGVIAGREDLKCDVATAISQTGLLRLFNVYPNPSTGMLQVEVELPQSDDVRLEVVNTQGQVIASRAATHVPNFAATFDLSDQAGGIYLLRVSTPQGSQTAKFFLQ
jgi:hypothetical protein